MKKIEKLVGKVTCTLKEEGVTQLIRKTKNYVNRNKRKSSLVEHEIFRDVLFINGCGDSVPHPPRYRITHQREQLLANNISSNEVFYMDLSLEQVRLYRVFVFFRCPYTEKIGEFIKLSKKLNKKVLFDIDDLVIDTKYTDNIPYLATISCRDKALYDDGVNRMGQTLSLCDAAITTTERLANELRKYVGEVFINRNTASDEMYGLSKKAIDKKIPHSTIKMGYFSGSLTHNSDFLMILPVIVNLLKEYLNLELHVVGELELPKELVPLKNRVISHPFIDWRKLPDLIAEVDINIAPLEDTVFNEAKSENKWVEAALVKVPTVASNVGAFRQMIENYVTGILCDNEEEWQRNLKNLIENMAERERIAENAYQFCSEECVSIYTGIPLVGFMKKYMTRNIAFVLPSLEISGGIKVALKHAAIMQERGLDVSLINVNDEQKWINFEGHQLPILSQEEGRVQGRFDKGVATMWTTVNYLTYYPNIGQRYYLVQGFETDFYEPNIHLRILANLSYSPLVPFKFVTISKWCQKWLKEKYYQVSEYAPNGIQPEKFLPINRDFSGKIRILIEGDCEMYYKNIDESFAIVDKLDAEKFEIWYMSYNAKPKPFYKVDKFLHKVPFDDVGEVYRQCHILLKTSLLDSFSYPPLEMMCTGGYVVVLPNDGNVEYIKNEKNCLTYRVGDIDSAVSAIHRICSDEQLRKCLHSGAMETVDSRDWNNIKDTIYQLYEN